MQANTWIKEMYGKKQIKILRQNLSFNEIYFILDTAISCGE